MTKAAALHRFYNTFLPAYEENSVSDCDYAEMPYITYELITGDLGGEIALSISLWYRGDSWVEINAKTEEISKAIGRGGKVLKCDGGVIWIKRGTPFAQSMGDPNDDKIKRKYINLTAEFITAD